MKQRLWCRFLIVLLAVFGLGVGNASAKGYPNRPIKIVVPYPAGGGGDAIARIIAHQLSKSMHAQFIVSNRPGGSSIIGAEIVAKAAPDGYTLLLTFDPPFTTLKYILRNVPFNALTDFTPITMLVRAPQALVVNPKVPAKTLRQFIAYVKKHPGDVFCGTPGVGSSQHFAVELLDQDAHIKLVPVQYKGIPPAMRDVIAGQIQAMIATMATVGPFVRNGKLRALASIDSTRGKAMPNLPTFSEAGVPGYSIPPLRIGLFGPAHMPRAITRRLYKGVRAALRTPALTAKLEKVGFVPDVDGPTKMARTLRQTGRVYNKIAKRAGIHPH